MSFYGTNIVAKIEPAILHVMVQQWKAAKKEKVLGIIIDDELIFTSHFEI